MGQKSDERAAVIEENLKECRSLCMFFLFLIIFTSAMMSDTTASAARLADHIATKIDDGPIELEAVSSFSQTYSYLRQVLIPALYVNNTDTNLALSLSSYYQPIDLANRLVGGVRLRQVRVKYTTGCQVGPLFSKFTISCYPTISGDTESKDAFGDSSQFTWSSDPYGTPYVGYLATYPADGYIEVLPTDREEALAMVDTLESQKFMGPWTRALFIDFVAWNMNFGTYAVTTLNIEYGASSGVASHVAMLTMSPRALAFGGSGDAGDTLDLFLQVLVIVFTFYFVFEEVQDARKYGMAVYITDLWNVMDWVNNALLLAAFGVRVFVYAEAQSMNIGQEQLTDKDAFPSLRSIAAWVELVKLLNAVNAVFLYAKVIKYLRHMPVTRDLINTFWKALDLFVPFLFMFIVGFVGFGMSYTIGFGDRIWELSTLGSAITYMCRSFLKDVNILPAYRVMPAFGAMLILIFYIVFLVLGANVLFATIADAMLRAKTEPLISKEDLELHKGEPIEEFIREIKRWIKRQVKRRAPRLYKRIYGRRKKVTLAPKAEEKEEDLQAEFVMADSDSDESQDEFEEDLPKLPDKEDLMRSIEHMAGRILSEVSIVSIEIKSELHDVCERVAQMQMAVEELSSRADLVRMEQEEFLFVEK